VSTRGADHAERGELAGRGGRGGPWRMASASSTGTSHRKVGTPCQDAARCCVQSTADGAEILIAAVSDGASSAAYAEQAARCVVEHFVAFFSQQLAQLPDVQAVDRSRVLAWFEAVRQELRSRAANTGASLNEYACTFVGALVGREHAVYSQIGDGAIVVSNSTGGSYTCVFAPQHGEYANSTCFVTQEDAQTRLQVALSPAPTEIALFSDGIERLLLDLKSPQPVPHAPAFTTLFQWLAGTSPEQSESASRGLFAYLESEHINSRTDDDKTLVLATCAERAAPPA
jgi:hypothetical protein